MAYLLLWWIVLVVIGFAALPVAFRLFSRLPDRGYAFAKPLGLLLVAYPFWLLTCFGLLENTFGAIALTLVLVAVFAWGITWWRGELGVLWNWVRENARYAIVVELVFTLALFAFSYYRSFNPEITATEKPMEFMFLNSILRSVQFPPHDSWLSGFAISYYYLGYTIVALLTKLTSIPSNFTFNLGLAMVFALSATGAFGLGYNLVKAAANEGDKEAPVRRRRQQRDRPPYMIGILTVVMLLVIGNLEAPFESLHNVGFGSADLYGRNGLDVNGLAQAPVSGTLVPTDNWWWWRASRVVNDHNPVNDEHIEVIDEFPSFSFLLGDLHPHVLALPFDLLALAVAFNLLRAQDGANSSLMERARRWLTPGMFLSAVIVGSLGMLNTWDLVTYGLVIIAAYAISRVRAQGAWARSTFVESGLFGVVLFAASYLLFLPFYLGFSSQVQGIMVSVFFKTPLHQYLMMFGFFVFVLMSLLGVLAWQRRESLHSMLQEFGTWGIVFLAVPFVIAALGLLVLARSAELRNQAAAYLNAADPNQVMTDAVAAYFKTLVSSPGLFLLLVVLLAGIIAIVRLQLADDARQGSGPLSGNVSLIFALLIAFIGFGLTLGVEFLYVLDVFGSRMNTVFKLYFQAWTLFSAASGFGVYYIWRSMGGTARMVWTGAFGIIFALSLVFPVLAYPNRANNFQASTSAGIPTLDGTLWIKYSNPDDYAGIQWLNANAQDGDVILEAPGPQYSFYDRVSVATGLETVLGWGGHEVQWRGNGDEGAKREADVEQIFKTLDPNQASALLKVYKVDYVVVGGVEREKYGLIRPMIDKFGKLGELVFNQGSMQIFKVAQ